MSLLILLVTVCFILVAQTASGGSDESDEARWFVSPRSSSDCLAWYKQQPSPSVYLDKILSAPCKVPKTFPRSLIDGWTVDPKCDARKQPHTCHYHGGAWGCYRHSLKSTGPGAQACYDKQGNWIADPWKGAGTLDAETALGSLSQALKHYKVDVAPYYDCCKRKNLPQPSTCNMYFEKRPPGICIDKPAA